MKSSLSLNKKQTEHIADLVQLKLTDKELEKYSNELTDTLKYIEELNEIDTSSVAPTYQTTGLTNRFQNEKVGGRTLTQKEALSNASEKDGALFKIPAFNYGK